LQANAKLNMASLLYEACRTNRPNQVDLFALLAMPKSVASRTGVTASGYGRSREELGGSSVGAMIVNGVLRRLT
jgi:hypothetical protein